MGQSTDFGGAPHLELLLATEVATHKAATPSIGLVGAPGGVAHNV